MKLPILLLSLFLASAFVAEGQLQSNTKRAFKQRQFLKFAFSENSSPKDAAYDTYWYETKVGTVIYLICMQPN